MSEGNTSAEFLIQRYPRLPKSPEVAKAAQRTNRRTNEVIPKEPEAQIQNYLDRFRGIVEREDPKEKERGIKSLKKILTDRYVVRVEDIPESYWQSQMRIVRQRGEAGDWQEASEEEQLKIKQEHLAQTKEDQKGSLEEWIGYLISDKYSYLPDHLKYWAFQGMLRLERYEKGDKEKGIPGRFPERPTGRQRSVKMFPEVNERALKFIAQAYDAQLKNQLINFRYDIPESARQSFLQHLAKKDFRMLYGWGQEYIPPISEEEMKTTEGEWVTYKQGSESEALTRTLQGKGSGWCIAGEQLAQTYLSQGNLRVYYSKDREGNSTIPRVVIVQKGNRVTEVRGIEWEENVDKYIKESNIIGDKLKEIPGGEEFFEIDADTKRLTAIDRKTTAGIELDGGELAFLYETEKPIKYFGYKKDPRITELRSHRNSEEDMLVVFGCSTDQIAHSISQIRTDTKAYVGKLEPGIFDKLPRNIEHVYTSFPEGKIRKEAIEIGGKDFGTSIKELRGKANIENDLTWSRAREILEQIRTGSVRISAETIEFLSQLVERQINISKYALDMLESPDFTTLPTPQNLDTVRLKVQDLGLTGTPTTDQVYSRAKELGLELCPAGVGPHKRLKDANQPMGEWYCIAMKQITDWHGHPSVFHLERNEGGFWLSDLWALPGLRWRPKFGFVFSLRPSTTLRTGKETQKLNPFERFF